MRIVVTALLCILCWCVLALAQSETTSQSAHDWTGFYALARGKNLGGLKLLNPNLHEVIVAHLQPWARAKMEATDGVADDPGGTCPPDGIFRYPTFAGSFLWLPLADKMRALSIAKPFIYLKRFGRCSTGNIWNIE